MVKGKNAERAPPIAWIVHSRQVSPAISASSLRSCPALSLYTSYYVSNLRWFSFFAWRSCLRARLQPAASLSKASHHVRASLSGIGIPYGTQRWVRRRGGGNATVCRRGGGSSAQRRLEARPFHAAFSFESTTQGGNACKMLVGLPQL